MTLYSIGHSNHPFDTLLALLRQYGIELVIDVRSSPYSRYVPQANREALSRSLASATIAYRWLGDRLGGKPEGEPADYAVLRAAPAFAQGIAELVELAARRRTAMLCAEGDHRQCHRHLLIAPALVERGVHVVHIQPDGSSVEEEPAAQQLRLF